MKIDPVDGIDDLFPFDHSPWMVVLFRNAVGLDNPQRFAVCPVFHPAFSGLRLRKFPTGHNLKMLPQHQAKRHGLLVPLTRDFPSLDWKFMDRYPQPIQIAPF